MGERTARLVLALAGAASCAAAATHAPVQDGSGRVLAALAREVPRGLPADLLARDGATEAQLALGARLFADPLLSADGTVACVTCHAPEHGFGAREATSAGIGGQRTLRNVPTLANRALGRRFSWDGRAGTLEEQVLLPIENPREMGSPVEEAVARLAADPGYAAEFEAAFGGGPTRERLAAALAACVRRMLHAGSPVDVFRSGDAAALASDERAGLWLFESRAGCWRCHSGPNFSDEDFHSTGVGARDGVAEPGRSAVTGDPRDRGRFKTPTLRGLLDTAPYMHDGSLATLAEVVAFYREGGRPHPELDPHVAPLELSDAEAAQLVAFLGALSRR